VPVITTSLTIAVGLRTFGSALPKIWRLAGRSRFAAGVASSDTVCATAAEASAAIPNARTALRPMRAALAILIFTCTNTLIPSGVCAAY